MKPSLLFRLDRTRALWISVFLGVVVLGLDLITPPQILLSIYFVLPVGILAWYNGVRWGFAMAVVLTFGRFAHSVVVDPSPEVMYHIINAANRIVLLFSLSLIIARLSEAVRHIKVLEGLISICANCKKIRNQTGAWQPVEEYLMARSEVTFSHGICPECAKQLYGEYLPR